jgi:hypothetical protein
VTDLERALRQMELDRQRQRRRYRRNLLIIGVSVSLIVHLALMLYLNALYRERPAGPGTMPVSIEFAVIQEPQLTQLEQLQFEDLVPEVPVEDDELSDTEPALELSPDVSAAALDISATGAVPALTGSGRGDDSTLGGGAGTSFFGVSSKGTRFAYIVDVSGSMGYERKIDVAMRELARSIEVLPDYTYFYVVLYSNQLIVPPFQREWSRARPNVVSRLIRWLNQIDPSGGTRPVPAFRQVFSLSERPDVVFFLTDGLIPAETGAAVAELNRRGKRVTINTIAFGDPTSAELRLSQDLLREIATQSGGVFRFVPLDEY